ncbi:glycosyltransferase family 2 protein, partial [Klebsiella pneumoniae]|uniref:glycosyltransferase family 2 protein n=1 Tax=Klebsiella pneumoniae TaxID=573 RepID=UPI001157B618
MSERSSSALVSVVIPVHDAAEYISDTLSSILSQSLQDIEVIIIDDNSADDTLKLLQSFAANDSRIRLLNNSQNIGAGASRNMGLKIAGFSVQPLADMDGKMNLDDAVFFFGQQDDWK